MGGTEKKVRTKHTTPSTVSNVDGKPVLPDYFTLEKFLNAQNEDVLCQERVFSARDSQFCFSKDRYEISARNFRLSGPLQRVLSVRLRHGLLHQTQ